MPRFAILFDYKQATGDMATVLLFYTAAQTVAKTDEERKGDRFIPTLRR